MSKKTEDTFSPNPGQVEAIDKIGAFLEDPAEFAFTLSGPAGSGKSTILQRVFDSYGGRFAMSAPTHKAVGVLSTMALEKGLNCRIETYHKMLSLKKEYQDGETIFVPDPKRVPMVESYDALVVDECSMIGDELYGLILPYIEGERVKVIFTGDAKQLPPVQKDGGESPTFSTKNQHTLTQVMRNGGIIGDAIAAIRDNIEAVDVRLASPGRDDRGEIEVHGSRLWFSRFLSELEDESADVQALAYTNRSVDWINREVRKNFFGADAPPFAPGERLVAIETLEQFGTISFYTGDRMTVEKVDEGTEAFDVAGDLVELPCYFLEIRLESGRTDVISVLSSEQEVAFKKAMKAAKDAALKNRGLWGAFYELKERFARVRPGYATTIHKSQGSTYDRVFVAQSDVLNSTPDDPLLRNRLLYVAYSRTRSKLVLC